MLYALNHISFADFNVNAMKTLIPIKLEQEHVCGAFISVRKQDCVWVRSTFQFLLNFMWYACNKELYYKVCVAAS